MDTPHSNAMPIDHGPLAGWDISITHIRHGIDPMDDIYALDLWPPDTDQPAHTFETYRYAYGWDALNAALTGDDGAMSAALDWWTTNHQTPAYAAHRILVAIDATTWATRTEIASRLQLTPADLDTDHPYATAMAALERHNLTTWHNTRANSVKAGSAPLIALTPTAYSLIHPDDAATTHPGHSVAEPLKASGPPPQTTIVGLSRATKAFPRINDIRDLAPTTNEVVHTQAATQPVYPAR